jgi:hypothetical protein
MARDIKMPDAAAMAEEEEQYAPLQRVENLDEKYGCRELDT